MKKISLYFTLAFASLFLVSCNEDFDDWADPQSYLPEEAITIPGFAASATGAIDLANVDTDSVDIFNLTEVALPEGFELGNARVYLVPADIDGAAAVDLKADLQGRVLKSELQSLLENFYGMRPDPRALKATVMLDAVKDGQAVLINAGTIDLNITPAAPVIENTYYLVGSMTGWSDNDTSYPLVNGGGDVYSDPVFNIIIDATGEDIYF
ncbi:MAG: DUF5115 domain-containing protein, partial [Muribaculaceae bacterium]|nr:DUF5115 domain-containing protein [Muribaculaceae bacterium]